MTLGEKQRLFARLVAKLIGRVYGQGYACTLGHAWRTDARYKKRLHSKKLAIDLNLFRHNGQRWIYLRSTEAHREFGKWWEQQHPLCRWGGRFGDGNHYSVAHGGMK